MNRVLKVWKNKWQILEGIRYTLFPNKYVEVIAAKRIAICKTNVCGLYDPTGEGKICMSKVGGCCLGCGCGGTYKTHSLSSYCTLKDQGKYPLWDAEMSVQEEKKFREKTGLKNE